MINEAGHDLAEHAIVEDDPKAIRKQVKRWIKDPDVDVVITTGGTGFTGRDVTPEAVKPLFEKEIDGFSALFHMLSYQMVGTSTVQSRACGGVAKGTYIFCVPGSPGACRGCVGRHPQGAARQSPQALLVRRDHAAASGEEEADEDRLEAGSDQPTGAPALAPQIFRRIDVAQARRDRNALALEIGERVGKRVRPRPADAAKGAGTRGVRFSPTSQ